MGEPKPMCGVDKGLVGIVEEKITHGISQALVEERYIDTTTAKLIAERLHRGEDTALYNLARSGTIDLDRVEDELWQTYNNGSDQIRIWVEYLGRYLTGWDQQENPKDWIT